MGSGTTIGRYLAAAVLAIALTGPAPEAAAQEDRPLPRPQNLSSHLPEFFRDLLGGRVWVANPRGRPAAAYFGEDGFVKRCYWSNAKRSFVFNRGELRWRIGTPNGRSNLEIGWVTSQGERFWRVVLIYDRETGRLHGERFNRKKRSWYVSRDGWIQDGWPAAFRNACHDLVLPWDLATVSGQDSLDFEDMRRNASPVVRFPGSEFSFPGATGLGDSKGKPTMTVEQIAEEERRAHGTIRITAQGRRIVGIRPRSGTVWELWELDGDDDVTDIGSIGPVGDGSVVRVRWEKSGLSAHLRVEGSAITFAPPRTGKGATIALNYLAPGGRGWPGSTVLIDPRGETWCIVARRRREMGRRPVLMDPFGVVRLHADANEKENKRAKGKSNGQAAGQTNAKVPVDVNRTLHLPAVRSRCYNPLDFIREDAALAPRDINVLLDALLTPPGGGNDTSTHFYESARAIIAGFVAWVRFADGFGERNLQEVHRLLTLPMQDRRKVVEDMRTAEGPGAELVRVAAERQLQVGEQEAGSNFSTIANQLAFLNYPELDANTRRSDFDPMELAKGDVDLFVVVPEEMTEHARAWLRLWITIPNAVSSMTPLERDMLIVVDEMPRLGYLKPVMDGYNLAAGRGVHFWCFAQSVSALDKTWGPDSRRVLVELAEVLQILGFPRTDVTGAEALSAAIGFAGFEQWSETFQGHQPPEAAIPAGHHPRTSDQVSVVKERVVTQDDILTMGADDQFVIAAPKDMPRDAFALKHARYWSRPDARLLADPNPFVVRKRASAVGSPFGMYATRKRPGAVKREEEGQGDERGEPEAVIHGGRNGGYLPGPPSAAGAAAMGGDDRQRG